MAKRGNEFSFFQDILMTNAGVTSSPLHLYKTSGYHIWALQTQRIDSLETN